MLDTFADYLDRQNLATSTKRHYFEAARAYLCKYKTIDATSIQNYLFFVLKSTSESNHNRHLKALKHLCNHAGLAFPATIHKFNEKPLPRVQITDEEIDRIIAVNPTDKYGVFFTVLSYTGARPAEILQLKKSDIDSSAHLLHIRESKTGSRSVPILEPLQAVLYPYLVTLSTDYLFTKFGKPLTGTAYMDNWRMRLAKVGITKNVKPYAIRRSFITNTLSNGGSLFSIQDMVGHNSSETTKKYYHQSSELMLKAAQALPRARCVQVTLESLSAHIDTLETKFDLILSKLSRSEVISNDK